MKGKILTESDKRKIISDNEKLIIENFAKVFNSIKRVDESEINELSPELKQKAFNQADAEYNKYSRTQNGEEDVLKANRRNHQASSFNQIHPSLQKEADDIVKYLIPSGTASIEKHGWTPSVTLSFKSNGDYASDADMYKAGYKNRTDYIADMHKKKKYLNYIITKNNIQSESSGNVDLQPNIARRIERLARKIQNTEIAGPEGENELEEDFKSNLKGAAAGAAALAGGLNANAQQAPQAHQKISPGMQIQAPQAANTKADDGKTADPFNTKKSGGEDKYAQNHTKPIVDMARGQDGKTGKEAIFLYHVPKDQVKNSTIDQDRTTVYLTNFDRQVKGTPEWHDYVARCKALGVQIGAFAPIDTDYEGRDQSAAITNLKEDEYGYDDFQKPKKYNFPDNLEKAGSYNTNNGVIAIYDNDGKYRLFAPDNENFNQQLEYVSSGFKFDESIPVVGSNGEIFTLNGNDRLSRNNLPKKIK